MIQEMIYSFHHFILFVCVVECFILQKGNDEVKKKMEIYLHSSIQNVFLSYYFAMMCVLSNGCFLYD